MLKMGSRVRIKGFPTPILVVVSIEGTSARCVDPTCIGWQNYLPTQILENVDTPAKPQVQKQSWSRFDFGRALNEMRGGRKVRRQNWPTDTYLCFDYDRIEISSYVFGKQASACDLSMDDLVALDWEIAHVTIKE